MANKSKAKGTAAETRVVRYLQAAGLIADRQPLKGNRDEGDIWFVSKANVRGILEVKAGKQTLKYSRKEKELWLRQTLIEQNNAGGIRVGIFGYLVIAKHGSNIADYEVWSVDGRTFWYLDQFVQQHGGTPVEFVGGKPV